jgi:hypothetical protein
MKDSLCSPKTRMSCADHGQFCGAQRNAVSLVEFPELGNRPGTAYGGIKKSRPKTGRQNATRSQTLLVD